MANNDKSVSLKGLDDFSRKFLTGSNPTEEEKIKVSKGSKLSDAAMNQYQDSRKGDFVKRAGSFTEDMVAFVVEQRKLRDLSDYETIFGLALMSINFRHAYGSPQGTEKGLSAEERQKLLDTFDEICWGAQQYWDANQ
jgi:hypothetical protein